MISATNPLFGLLFSSHILCHKRNFFRNGSTCSFQPITILCLSPRVAEPLTGKVFSAASTHALVMPVHNLLDRHHPRRVLRSASAELFSVPFSQIVRHGDRRFSVAVATLWNQLPNSVRMIETLPLFRTHLKTHLFRVASS